MTELVKVGVISDTHGLLRPEALVALQGVDRIVHAGDIGAPDILSALGRLAPVTAVRGNTDRGTWTRRLPETASVELGGVLLFVIHDVHMLDFDPHAAGFAAVIAGHSHRPTSEMKDGVLYFNPGSAGPRRFRLPVALGFLSIRKELISAEILILEE